MIRKGDYHRRRSGLLRIATAVVAGAFAVLSGCAVGPDYRKPQVEAPAAYKENVNWKVAQPQEAIVRGAWWKIFADPQLDALVEQVNISNQNVAAADAQYRQALAVVKAARAGYFPTVTAGAQADAVPPVIEFQQRQCRTLQRLMTFCYRGPLRGNRISGARCGATSKPTRQAPRQALPISSRSGSATQALLAQNYFQLCAIDAQKVLLDDTVAAYQKSLELTKNRYAYGVASRAEVLQAETQLKSTQAQAIDLGVQRSQLEHAIAVLIGKPASVFSMPATPLTASPPAIPVGIPSELLERRPDIAAAERRVAAANAQIGVAEAAYYPSITLGATGGFESSDISNWLSWPSRLWSIGVSLSQTVFDAGLRSALTDQARAAYDATVASYRQTVLTGFQDVEDNLAALRILEEESRVQDEAVNAARRSVELSTNQYKAGTINYLAVVVVQAIALSNESTAVEIMVAGWSPSVLLIKAIGGGWNSSALPSECKGDAFVL